MSRMLINFAIISFLLTANPLVGDEKQKPQENRPAHLNHLERLNAANRLYESHKYTEAEAFTFLLDEKLSPEMEGKVLFNFGLTLQKQKKYDDAIAMFSRIFASQANDREPGAHLMQTNRNYRHRACLEIATCYELQQDFTNAIKYAELARDKHRYGSWCGTCMEIEEARLGKRIAELKIAGKAE